jgi:1,4-dihydroxy-6-naphthoate synthase
MSKQLIRLGHSPDPDDAFMFYGLAKGLVDSGPFEFKHILRDIQTLNEWALEGKLEVTAISVHAYAYLQDKYAILSSGASMGATELATYLADTDKGDIPITAPTNTDAHGPMIIAKEQLTLDELKGKKIAIPGKMTSAFLAAQLAIGKFEYEVVMFDEIIEAVLDGKVDAGLIIHEGQLTYQNDDLKCILDLGRWWFDQHALPMPLGCNTIRRDLGPKVMAQVSEILKKSILYSLEHRKEAVEYALQFGRGLDNKLADEFVGLYVNQWTVDYGPKGRQALTDFLQLGANEKIIPNVKPLEFV